MPNFVSSNTTALVSFICQEVPNLFKYIVKYSKVGSREPSPETPSLVTAEQITDARLHASKIMLDALNNVVAIQDTLNTANDKLEELLKQRNMIENTLLSLMDINDNDQKEKEKQE